MTLIDELPRLTELEAKATSARWIVTRYSDNLLEISREDGTGGFRIYFEDPDDPDPQFIADLRNAAPSLLAVAGKFQKGDIDEIDYAIQELNRIFGPDNVKETTDCLRRMADAAAIMEADGCLV